MSMLGPANQEILLRARADLRLGIPIVLAGKENDAIIAPIEVLSQTRLDQLKLIDKNSFILLTARRAQTLKCPTYDGNFARISLGKDPKITSVKAISDPSLDLRSPLKGPFDVIRDKTLKLENEALLLLKSAKLLPAAIVSKVDNGENKSDDMEVAIANYLTKVSESQLSKETSKRLSSMLKIIDELESMGDSSLNIARALSRAREKKSKLTPEMKENIHKVINIQGDMPFISKEHIKLLTSKIDYFEMSTLGCPFIDKKEFQDLNKVKLLIKEDNKNVVAENFFREPMHASEMNVNTFHHIGLYGYQISFLKKFLQMPISEREKTEKLEQLRIQDLNKIGVSIIKENILGVDTKEDLIKVNNILKK